ncbi:hypothetical protein GCM10025867_44250 [Frondihabitans sucicola]|uniref:Uncharacterized protein n=1 Tax=Frondihabitans sucicola TaxID=1268041 RepID=A0ABN6Y4F2_9MICO|nr:hypothetical protein [Frondihabitans sucicola]BDZ52184.1 hypothetical protein GCM10025867_44250 [Frondihabitans sucicola]
MDHDTRRFVREARRETRLLIEQCSSLPETTENAERPEDPEAAEAFDRETEVIMRSSIGGSANLAFFLPYLWKHRH